MNTFGQALRVTTFGESHGEGIGCVIDGLPAGLKIDESFIESMMKRRAPGLNRFSTQRKEADRVQILSGVFQGFSTGTPIGLWIANTSSKSSDYDNIKDIFRPGHALFSHILKNMGCEIIAVVGEAPLERVPQGWLLGQSPNFYCKSLIYK